MTNAIASRQCQCGKAWEPEIRRAIALAMVLMIAVSGLAQEPCQLTKPCEDFAPKKFKQAHKFLPPKQINVCGKKMAVEVVDYIPESKYFRHPFLGYTYKDKIVLLDIQYDHEMAETLSHEIMHVILTVNASDDVITVHQFIEKLSPCYIDTIFHSNPDLLVYFIGAGYHMHLEPEQKLVPTTEKKH